MPRGDVREELLAVMRSPAYRPMTRSELARHLSLPADKRGGFKEALAALLQEGLVEEGRKSRYQLRQTGTGGAGLLEGVIKFHPRGHALFFPDTSPGAGPAPKVFISRRDTGTALDGDRVAVALQRRGTPGRGRRGPREILPAGEEELRGEVRSVLARRSGRLVGIYRSGKRGGWVECDDKSVDGSIALVGDTTAQPGQTVVVDLRAWNDPSSAPCGRIIEVLGWPGEPGLDILGVIHRYGLKTSFPEEVLAEARSTGETPDPDELRRRRDWRDKLVITIDPADAKDHDDAVWVERHRAGWTLAVHIADVSHYIRPGAPMDREAVERGNSTYLVDRVLPMLPVELSNGICSLKPDVDRLTKCALLTVSSHGEITRANVFDAVIHSRAKLSYEQAQTILDGGKGPDGCDPQLEGMVREAWNMAAAMRKRRFGNGALDLEMPEIKVVLDAEGRACGARPVEHSASHQLIEECMLAANEAVARLLRQRMKPALYRVHEDPDPSRLLDYTQTALQHGYRPGDLTNRAHIQALLDQAKGRPEEHIIKLGLLKSLKRAAYSADPLGHYGLAKVDYCHFTSPIRRYADLIVHRALQPLLDNPPARPDRTPGQAALQTMARHISDTERTSAEAESETKMIKLFEYLQRIAERHEPEEFHGLVTEVRPMGVMVEVPAMAIRGVVKSEDLLEGRWRYEAHRLAWASAAGVVVQPGMRSPLHVLRADPVTRFLDFAMAGPPSGGLLRPVAERAATTPPRMGKRPPKPPKNAGPTRRRKGSR